MRYANMDHAGWMENSIAATKRRPVRRRTGQPQGLHTAPDKLNDFQRRAVTILGIALGGIYNAPVNWERSIWSERHLIVQLSHRTLATWDFMELTLLVFLAHEARVRVSISAVARNYLDVSFHERQAEGGMSQRHPSLEEAVADFRAMMGEAHPMRRDVAGGRDAETKEAEVVAG